MSVEWTTDTGATKLIISKRVLKRFQIRRVTAADTIVVPAYSEKLIDVFIDRFETDKNVSHYIFCIEPSEDFNNRFPLLMASCLTDLSNKVTTKVRVMNPIKTDVSIQQDEVLGKAELIDPKNIDVILSSDSLFRKPTIN